ncbi:hypothetical protein D3C78_533030 [compost metagenome]
MLEAQDHLLHLIGGHLGAPRQGPYFIGDHGKATAHLTRPRRLDGGVERQQVGLLGDAADHRQHFVDRRHFRGQLTHCTRRLANLAGHALDMGNRAAYHFAGLQRFGARGFRRHGSVTGVLRNVLHGQAHLMHGSGDHFGHFLLAVGTFGGVLYHLRHLRYRRAQAFAGVQHFANQVTLAVEKAVEATGQVAQLVCAVFVQALGQVAAAIADGHQGPRHTPDGADDAAGQQHHQQQRYQRDRCTNQAGQPDGLTYLGIDLCFWHLGDQGPVEVTQR